MSNQDFSGYDVPSGRLRKLIVNTDAVEPGTVPTPANTLPPESQVEFTAPLPECPQGTLGSAGGSSGGGSQASFNWSYTCRNTYE